MSAGNDGPEDVSPLSQDDKPIVASGYAGTVGVPALFDARYFDALASIPDNAGAKSFIESNRTDLVVVAFPEGAIDIDTQADYAKL